MTLISYNLNGIRSACSKGLGDWFAATLPDIFCIQETKAQPEQIDCKSFEQLGYQSYWHSAQRKGYSGVGIVSRIPFDRVDFGIGIEKFDAEGRLIRADMGDTTLICSYFPSGTMGDVRQAFKMEYLEAFADYICRLRQDRPKLILTGDFNICHKPIDINNPEKHTGVSGFLPEEREWFDRFVALGFTDSFRHFCDRPNRYSWWSYRAGSRHRNVGWRIDYFLVSDNLCPRLQGADILDQVVHSDHCPVVLHMEVPH
ncbi:MAG: exodeoxyribonuclease III [Bacteroidales bacterium]|nr:exodeoxyribonuclease III [Bacteroidales bacterium]MCL2739142.1 exodeoxyribonuclease III [Bacteroidales bacterium]